MNYGLIHVMIIFQAIFMQKKAIGEESKEERRSKEANEAKNKVQIRTGLTSESDDELGNSETWSLQLQLIQQSYARPSVHANRTGQAQLTSSIPTA